MLLGNLYILLAAFLLFAVIVKGVSNQMIGAKTATVLAVFIPFVIAKTILLIVYTGYQIPLVEAFQLRDLIEVTAQLIAAYTIFRILDQDEEWMGAVWVLAAAFGAGLLYLAIPYLVGLLPL